jgi:hypothetical protein
LAKEKKSKKKQKVNKYLRIIVNRALIKIVEKHASEKFTTPWIPITIKEVDG